MSSIGDIILTTPLLRSLRKKFPQAEIHFVVKQEFVDLMVSNPNVNQVIAFDKQVGFSGLWQLARLFRKAQYDLCLDLHGSLRSRFLLMVSGFGSTAGYSKQLFNRFMLIRFKLNTYRKHKPVFLRYFEAVEKLGVHYDGLGTEVFLKEEADRHVRQLLKQNGMGAGRKMLVICPGAAHMNKQWLPERFAQVADHFISAGWEVVFHGGRKEKELCSGILAMMQNKSVTLAGELTLAESAALLKQADCVLTNDSGLMHLAQSQKVPVVVLFGPTTRELGFFPLPENSIVIEEQLNCRPCTFKGAERCPQKHFQCMNGILVSQVIDGICKLALTNQCAEN